MKRPSEPNITIPKKLTPKERKFLEYRANAEYERKDGVWVIDNAHCWRLQYTLMFEGYNEQD